MKVLAALKSRVGKKVTMATTAVTLVVGSAMTACAAEADVSATMATTLQASMNSMVNDFIGYVGIVLPIGLTVFGCVWGVKKAKQFFAGIAKG